MNRLKTTILLSLLTLLMVLMGSAIYGKNGMILAFPMALAMNFFSYQFPLFSTRPPMEERIARLEAMSS